MKLGQVNQKAWDKVMTQARTRTREIRPMTTAKVINNPQGKGLAFNLVNTAEALAQLDKLGMGDFLGSDLVEITPIRHNHR